MKIHTIVVGPIDTNCCIAYDEDTKEGVIIDPGENAKGILSFVRDNGLKIGSVIATHGHWDHVTAAAEVKAGLNVPFMVNEKDAYLFSETIAPFAALMGFRSETVGIDRLLHDGDEIAFSGNLLEVIHTPGHTPGSSGFYSAKDKVLFSGDTLFRGDVGRTDFPGGSAREIIKSVTEKLFKLPDDTFVIPGHGQTTNILKERTDPYLIKVLSGN